MSEIQHEKPEQPATPQATAPTAVLSPGRKRSHPNTAGTTVQCSRCLNTMEIPPERVRMRLRCTKCHRNLRMPRSIRQACPYCGSHCEFRADASGRRVKCTQCGVRLQIPVQVVRPKHRRRRTLHRPRQQGSLIPLVVALSISILGLMLCFRLLASL